MNRVYNFAPGPSMLATEVLEKVQKDLLCYGSTGMSVMEMSHRSKMYLEIFEKTVADFKDVMGVPEGYKVMFLQGGATAMFSAVPLNLMQGGKADYIDSGNFAHNALVEAQKYGEVNVAGSSREDNYTYIPDYTLSPDARYVHITTNNTIYGTRYDHVPDTGDIPLVADMSSNILSEVYDVSKFGVIYAGAQKNIGPAGVTLVIVRKDLLGHASPICPKVLNWTEMTEKDSMLNTPPTYAIYMAGLCMKWLKKQGGVEGIEQVNIEKSKLLYDLLDESAFYIPKAEPASRSRMNVTFTTPDPDTDALFVKEAAAKGLTNLKGHRMTGGIRASIYNAMPVEGVQALVRFMKEFETEHK